MPDGTIWNGLRRLRKDNTGYCLRQLLVGSRKARWGMITASGAEAVAGRIWRSGRWRLCALPTPGCGAGPVQPAAAAVTRRRWSRSNIWAAPAWIWCSSISPGASSCRWPRRPHYCLGRSGHAARTGRAARHAWRGCWNAALEDGDGAGRGDRGKRGPARWRCGNCARSMPEAQKREGASVKNDVSVPVSRVPELLARGGSGAGGADPRGALRGIRPYRRRQYSLQFRTAGGDGWRNFPGAEPRHYGCDRRCGAGSGWQFLGPSTAVGQLKPDMMEAWRGGAELDAMQKIKAALDPAGLDESGQGAAVAC